jgi:hypothetical protein
MKNAGIRCVVFLVFAFVLGGGVIAQCVDKCREAASYRVLNADKTTSDYLWMDPNNPGVTTNSCFAGFGNKDIMWTPTPDTGTCAKTTVAPLTADRFHAKNCTDLCPKNQTPKELNKCQQDVTVSTNFNRYTCQGS